MSTPYAKSYRWFTFTITDTPIDSLYKHIRSAHPDYAEWWTTEAETIVGYLFFPTSRPIPRKRLWIPKATFTGCSREKAIATLNKRPAEYHFIGETPAINWKIAVPYTPTEEDLKKSKQRQEYVDRMQLLSEAVDEKSSCLKSFYYLAPDNKCIPRSMVQQMLRNPNGFLQKLSVAPQEYKEKANSLVVILIENCNNDLALFINHLNKNCSTPCC